MMIKRVAAHNADGSYQLAGDSIDSIPQTGMGRVQRQQILGKAVLKLGREGITLLL